jgi:16S rRNA (uracil1498-N3)-methyltransferase
LLWEGEQTISLREALAECNLAGGADIQFYVGPEGGFTEAEIRLARRYGIQTVSLGPRILRGETAGIAAAVAIFYAAGDMDRPPQR